MAANNKQLHNSVIFEIDSASVAGAVFEYGSDTALPHTEHFSVRKPLDTHKTFESFFAHTLKVFEQVANEVLMHTSRIDSIYVSLGTPWMSSQKRVVHFKKDKAFKVTEQLVHDLIEKEISEPLTKNLDYRHHSELEIFERRTTDIYLNGYPTLNPYRNHPGVTDLAIHSLTSVISRTTKEAFTHVIERVFHREPKLISNTFVLYQSVRSFVTHEDNVTVVDLGGTNTQVCIIENDHLREIASFPVGEQHLVEQLAEQASVPVQKARSLLKLYTEQSLDPQYQEELSQLMKSVYRTWLASWYEVATKLSAKKLLPPTICLLASSTMSSWMRFHLLQTDELHEHFPLRKSPEIIELSVLLNMQSKEHNLDEVSDLELVPLVDIVGKLILNEHTYE